MHINDDVHAKALFPHDFFCLCADTRSACARRTKKFCRADYSPRRRWRHGPWSHTKWPAASRSIQGLLPKIHSGFQAAANPDTVFAAKDSKKSHRPRLTVEPFAKAANVKIDTRFGNNDSNELAADLRANQQGKVILICWRHPYIPALLGALGANPKTFLPNGKWPGAVYDWVILLSFDQDGRLIPASSKKIDEHLMPGDSE